MTEREAELENAIVKIMLNWNDAKLCAEIADKAIKNK